MTYPLGNRALKRICGKRIMCGRIGVGGIEGGTNGGKSAGEGEFR